MFLFRTRGRPSQRFKEVYPRRRSKKRRGRNVHGHIGNLRQAALCKKNSDRTIRIAGRPAVGEDEAMATRTTGRRQDEACWQALLARGAGDAAQAFWYGVTSTGIVCRPTCPSRRPRRENTRFFSSLQAALQAGYRPCLRCRPDQASAEPATKAADRMDRVRRYMEAHVEDGPIPLATLAQVAGLSKAHFQRSFCAALGVTPAQYARRLRMQKLTATLPATSVTDALYSAGFGSTSRLYEVAHNELGMTPGAHKRKGKDMTMTYTIADSPLGRMLVAATTKGICSVAFADNDDDLLQALRERFSAAVMTEDTTALAAMVAAVVGQMTESAIAMKLPLDVRATAFQARVWQALQAIPRGETRSYAQVAASIGQPTAARAVARACASNPVAVAIPCHRVVGSNGALTGYRWGTARKQRLLQLETVTRA